MILCHVKAHLRKHNKLLIIDVMLSLQEAKYTWEYGNYRRKSGILGSEVIIMEQAYGASKSENLYDLPRQCGMRWKERGEVIWLL